MRKFLYKYIISRFYHIIFGINMTINELDLSGKKCLCLAPHPDDESIGMGGTISKYPDNFDVFCLTDGSMAGSNLSKEELIETRKNEFFEAMSISKVKNFKMMALPDKKMLINSCESLFDISEYDYIFIPNIMDQHRDHKSTSAFVSMLLKTKHKKDLKIGFYEVWSTLALPNYFVDISDNVEIKKQMINAHKSQVSGFDYTTKSVDLNSYRGLHYMRNYCEAFMIFEPKIFRKFLKACGIISW